MANKAFLSLKKRSEFIDIKNHGHRYSPNSWFLVNYQFNTSNEHRFGLTVPKYVGNAVVRNRIKRWCREYFRTNKFSLEKESGININVIFKKKDKEFYKELTYEKLGRSLEKSVKYIERR